MESISWKNMSICAEIFLLLIKTKHYTVKGIINAFDHMELCLLINVTKGGN